MIIRRWTGQRYRTSAGDIGETLDATGAVLVANRAYRLDNNGLFVRASKARS